MASFLFILFLLLSLLILMGHRASEADWGRWWRNVIDGWLRLFCRYYHRLEYEPLPLPQRGPALVASNHLSGLDPLLLITASRRPLRFLIAQEEYHRFGLNWLFRAAGCIPVDRKGRPEKALRRAREALQRGEVVALFPHGRIHLDSDPPRPVKKGVVRLACWCECPIFPVRLDGIRGERLVLGALVIRSRVRLKTFPPIYCREEDEQARCLEQLRRHIEGGSGE